jgi:hypothetical protein
MGEAVDTHMPAAGAEHRSRSSSALSAFEQDGKADQQTASTNRSPRSSAHNHSIVSGIYKYLK